MSNFSIEATNGKEAAVGNLFQTSEDKGVAEIDIIITTFPYMFPAVVKVSNPANAAAAFEPFEPHTTTVGYRSDGRFTAYTELQTPKQ
jgi:hypothetical protein